MKERRERFTDFFTDIIKRWCELNSLTWNDNYYIYWKQETILTEREEAEIDNIEATTSQTLITAGVISADEDRKKRGLEGPAPEPPMQNQIGFNFKGDNKDDEEQDDEVPDSQ